MRDAKQEIPLTIYPHLCFSTAVSVDFAEDLKDDDDGTRGVDPVAPRNSDDGLDLLWIIIMIVAGCVVLCLICVAYLCMRQHYPDQDGEDGDDGEAAKDGADTNDEEEEDEVEEKENSEEDESVGNVVEPNDEVPNSPGLGRFEVSNE